MQRPNILFILIDDLGWRDLACYGSTFYETPNLDRLAAQGLQFTNAYASCPVCSPTRASIMTGKYPARVGITQYIGGNNSGKLSEVPYLHYLPLEETSVATALREGGYQTWHVGKWHLGDEPFYPTRHGFDVNIGGCHHGMPPRPHHHWSPYAIPTLPPGPPGEYLADRLTNEAIKLLQTRDKSRPFYLNLWHYAVHTPLQAPEHLVEKYRQKARALKLDTVQAIYDGEIMPKIWPESDKPHQVRRRMIQSDPVYAAMVENLDTNVGRLLDALEQEGLVDNTLVIFTSDNGGLSTAEGSPTCNLPLSEGKGWAEEGGTRVCKIVRFPGVTTPGTQTAAVTTSTDYYPTFLEVAGLPLRPAQHCDGTSFLPVLQNRAARPPRDAIFWHYPHYSNQGGEPASSILTSDGRWKLIEYFEDRRVVLFDLAGDISETRNIAAEHPQIVAQLTQRLHAWQQDVAAKIPQPNPQYTGPRPAVPNNAHE